jgi:hypothetical protein
MHSWGWGSRMRHCGWRRLARLACLASCMAASMVPCGAENTCLPPLGKANTACHPHALRIVVASMFSGVCMVLSVVRGRGIAGP